jgi:hypothetical protein
VLVAKRPCKTRLAEDDVRQKGRDCLQVLPRNLKRVLV